MGRPSQDICSHSSLFLCFFTSFYILLLFQCAFHLFDRWATFVAIERDLEVCVITGSKMGTASGEGAWGGLQGHMKEKMKRDPVDPGICGWKQGRRAGKMKAWAQQEAGR